MPAPLPAPAIPGQPLTALAPMQDVTGLAFMRVAAHCGAPDYFVTEFFRVHAQSRPEKHILRAIDENPAGRPVFAQLIGADIAHLLRTIDALLRHPVAGIDLNLGCPAPKVFRKNVGGGLLREPGKIAKILAALRAAVPGLLTVKMRIGFEDTGCYDAILDLVNEHRIDLLAVHGRTVRELYRGEVRYDAIARAVARVRCPVMANGDITSAAKAARVLAGTRAAGVMIGRHAIRNPWIFRQCREHFAGRPVTPVTLADVRDHIDRLYDATRLHAATGAPVPEAARVARMKKFLNFTGQSVDADGAFLRDMRRAATAAGLFAVCDRHLLAEPAREFALEPHPGLVARPNCE
ncbi:MAG: tRNA-dihydrouridine synthase family protein [Opitutaceae bacterium]|jgi:tRNA-dihydrouridine synthase|nr:tRNA-dihydrouridine synthase family protein [Opitutaceae bacterium]